MNGNIPQGMSQSVVVMFSKSQPGRGGYGPQQGLYAADMRELALVALVDSRMMRSVPDHNHIRSAHLNLLPMPMQPQVRQPRRNGVLGDITNTGPLTTAGLGLALLHMGEREREGEGHD
eukprot:g25936.t1